MAPISEGDERNGSGTEEFAGDVGGRGWEGGGNRETEKGIIMKDRGSTNHCCQFVFEQDDMRNHLGVGGWGWGGVESGVSSNVEEGTRQTERKEGRRKYRLGPALDGWSYTVYGIVHVSVMCKELLGGGGERMAGRNGKREEVDDPLKN